MTTGTAVALPANMELPAHLRTDAVAAAVAAANAAAAGGIKIGSFPRISIKGSKFHLVKDGEITTLTDPANPNLPLMQMDVVIVAANPGISKVFYEGDYQMGDDREPNCSSDNGIVPDAHIAVKQHTDCATCPQNAWGSKVSKVTQKDVKACSDTKRLAVIPSKALKYPAAALVVTPAALKDWGAYVSGLSQRGIPVDSVITLLTFDMTAAFPKLQFTFGGFLSAEDYALAQARAKDDDVRNIVAPQRSIAAPRVPALPKPAEAAPPPPPTGFGAPSAPAATPATPPTTPQRAPRAPRAKPPAEAQAAAATAAAATAAQVAGITGAAQQAATAVVDPYAGQPAHVKLAVDATGGLDTPAGQSTYKALTGKDYVAAPPAQPQGIQGGAAPAPAAAATPSGFGGAPATPAPAAAASAAATATAGSLAARLAERLKNASAPAA